jgi:F-type H+-transporting ATPase subunit b
MTRIALLVLFVVMVAFAASAESPHESNVGGAYAKHESGHTVHDVHFSDICWMSCPHVEGGAHRIPVLPLAATFLIFLAILWKFGLPSLRQTIASRSNTVRDEIEKASRAKADAEARASAAEVKLAALATEVKKMKDDFTAQGKAEMTRMEAAAQELAVRLSKDAEETIVAETSRAMASLQAEASRLALVSAEERIRAALSADDDARLQKTLAAATRVRCCCRSTVRRKIGCKKSRASCRRWPRCSTSAAAIPPFAKSS